MPLSMQDSSKLVENLRNSTNMPAASMGGDVFVKAAQEAGLSDDVNILNQIVSLVNQGKSPSEAASIIAGQNQGIKNAIR
jgi:hypothetical protein